jgi:hypothetical protein
LVEKWRLIYRESPRFCKPYFYKPGWITALIIYATAVILKQCDLAAVNFSNELDSAVRVQPNQKTGLFVQAELSK